MKPLSFARRLPESSRSYLVVNYNGITMWTTVIPCNIIHLVGCYESKKQTPMLKTISSSESLPAVPEQIVIERFSELPQRTDYVVPNHESGIIGVHVGLQMALAIHKFLEVNAVMSEHRELADRLRDILEGGR